MTAAIRALIIEGDVARIPMPCGRFAIIDAADAPLAAQFNWRSCAGGRNTYAVTRRDGERLVLHRLILGGTRGSIIDHASGDGLDCRRANIRFASHAENMRNRRHGVNNTSGYKGVHWQGKSSKWRAQIRVNGKNVHLGVFISAEAAANAYRLAAAKYHGDFARAA